MAYRLVTYQNLALLYAAFTLISSKHFLSFKKFNSSRISVLCAVCITLSAAGVLSKITHVIPILNLTNATAPMLSPESRKKLSHLPPEAYVVQGYATPGFYQDLTAEENQLSVERKLGVGDSEEFGKSEALALDFPQETWIKTQVETFPWNKFWIDHEPVLEQNLRRWAGYNLAVRVPSGRHILSHQFAPPTTWLWMRKVSLLAFIGFFITLIVQSRFWKRKDI